MATSRFSFNPNHQRGATLVEVLVSVFLVTFGVLGLMAAQLRSVASISEAENRNTVGLAAENLADGMQFNPVVEKQATAGGVNVVRRYNDYLTGAKKINLNATPTLPKPLVALNSMNPVEKLSKEEIAKYQLSLFEYGLMQLPNVVDIQYAICLDSSEADPIYVGGVMNPRCVASGGAAARTVIKVLWVVRGENATSDPVVFTYKVHVAQ